MKKIKKYWLILAGLIIAVLVFLVMARGLSGEDSWICQEGQWIKHGNPSAPMPGEPCGDEKNKENGDSGDQQLIGGQKDEHGCLIPAGYSWCEEKKKCLRTWEEKCEE